MVLADPRGNLHSYWSPHFIALNVQGWGLGGESYTIQCYFQQRAYTLKTVK